jgi:hypothetical protein
VLELEIAGRDMRRHPAQFRHRQAGKNHVSCGSNRLCAWVRPPGGFGFVNSTIGRMPFMNANITAQMGTRGVRRIEITAQIALVVIPPYSPC